MFFKCRHTEVKAFRTADEKVGYRCAKCRKRLYRIAPDGNRGNVPSAWNIKLDIARDSLLARDRELADLEPKTADDFVLAIAQRFREKATNMSMGAAHKLAFQVYQEFIELTGCVFGHKDYDWSKAAAHEIADEYMAEFFEPASN